MALVTMSIFLLLAGSALAMIAQRRSAIWSALAGDSGL